MTVVIILIVVALVAFAVWKIYKIPKLGNMTLITGGIKTGKSTLSVYLALRKYRRTLIFWYIKCGFMSVFMRKKLKPEKPLFYSNIPVKCKYVPITKELLLRQERFAYKSVIYICESSLIADSQLIRNQDINERLLLFNKLIAHETRGGCVFYDTQSISDCHYSIKRALSSYLYIHHTFKYCPFYLLMWVREFKYNEDNSIVNTVQTDVEDDLKLIIVPKRIWKKFDCYAFSSMTDKLPVNRNLTIPVNMKVEDLVSFREFKSIGGNKNDKI